MKFCLEMRENCGVLGIKYKDRDCVNSLCEGIFHLQHRGQEYCGIATHDKGGMMYASFPGLVSDNMTPEKIGRFHGKTGIAHTSLLNPQPVVLMSRIGRFALAFSGKVINSRSLISSLTDRGMSFSTGFDVEILAKLIAEEKDIVEGLKKLADKVVGSYSLVLLSDTGKLYCMRDPLGVKPLILGISSDGAVVASESCAINWLGMETVRDVEPGAIYLIQESGPEKIAQVKTERTAFCAFEYAYTARLDSVIEGIPVSTARDNLGSRLAQNDDIEADVVAGIPMSGLGHALGYHRASGLPYGIIFNYNPYALGRSYIPPIREERIRIAERKLYAVEAAVKGQRIVLCDDSIVRGTQIGDRVRQLQAMGAREVHVRIGAPKLNYPCKYGVSTRSQDELIGYQRTVEDVRKILGATTLKYNSVEDFVKAIGLPADKLCLGCWTGEYPST